MSSSAACAPALRERGGGDLLDELRPVRQGADPVRGRAEEAEILVGEELRRGGVSRDDPAPLALDDEPDRDVRPGAELVDQAGQLAGLLLACPVM